MSDHRYAMIMAGGSGTRLWPLSRTDRPKQLIEFLPPAREEGNGSRDRATDAGGTGRSLLQLSAWRLEGVVPSDRLYVCTGERHRDAVRRALPGLSDDRVLGEPAVRDTVNAIGLAATVLARRDPEAVFAVVTSDHVIEPVEAFASAMRTGFGLVERDPSRIVTFSITPTHAATQYGYVELGDPIGGSPGSCEVVRFVEKPDADRARRYVESGRFGWNAGMFVFSARTLLGCLERFVPDSAAGLVRIGQAWDTPDRARVLEEVYPTLPKISVDYAVMEQASQSDDLRVCAVEMPVRWLDVGSWPSFAQTLDPDESDNRIAGPSRVVLEDCQRTLIVSEGDSPHTIAMLGCEGLIVVRTPDATLIMPADRADALKTLHSGLPEDLT